MKTDTSASAEIVVAEFDEADLATLDALPRVDRNPCVSYLMSLKEKNTRPTMKYALYRAVKLFRSKSTPERFPWHQLRVPHTGFLHSELLELPPATANQTQTAVRGVLEHAWTLELISTDDHQRAIKMLKAVKGTRLPMGRYLEREEIDAMLAACVGLGIGARNRVIVLMLANSGLRRDEIATLPLHSIRLEKQFFTVIGKGNKERAVHINTELDTAIREWLVVRGPGPGPLLLAANSRGALIRDRTEPLDGEAIFASINSLQIAAGLAPVTPHDFRRTFISNMLDGADMGTVSKIVGHDDPKTTARYDRRDERTQKAAMEHARGLPAVANQKFSVVATVDADGVDIEWANHIELRIRETYERMARFRRVPPPESIVYSLLLHVQNDVCFMCRHRLRSDGGLIQDHDHQTGMVRALLCRGCNVIEGKAGRRPWPTYRKLAPANGLYCRYFGRGEQWRGGDPDPLSGRMKLPAHADLRDLILDPAAHLKMYLEVVDQLPDTPIPITCQRRFDLYSSRPMLLPGERSATHEEMVADGWGGWPIRGEPTSGYDRSAFDLENDAAKGML